MCKKRTAARVRLSARGFSLGDIEIPIYQRVNGNQLDAPLLSKLILAYTF